ncbi:hypothetical protein ACRRTK_009549 [Alexandromys fortis]
MSGSDVAYYMMKTEYVVSEQRSRPPSGARNQHQKRENEVPLAAWELGQRIRSDKDPRHPYERRRRRAKEQDARQPDSPASARSARSVSPPRSPGKPDASAAHRLRRDRAGFACSPGIRSPPRLRVPAGAPPARE